MIDISIRQVIYGVISQDPKVGKPIRAGIMTRAACAEIIFSTLLTAGEIDVNSDRDSDRSARIILEGLAFAEQSLNRSLGTNLAGYLAIAQTIALKLRRES